MRQGLVRKHTLRRLVAIELLKLMSKIHCLFVKSYEHSNPFDNRVANLP
jgi:hypothetical protein